MNRVLLCLDQDNFTIIPNFPQFGTWMLHINPLGEDFSNTRYSLLTVLSFTPSPILQNFGNSESRFEFKFTPFSEPSIRIIPYIGILAPKYFNLSWFSPQQTLIEMESMKNDIRTLQKRENTQHKI